MVDISDAVDRELEMELRRAENGGREVGSDVEEVGGVLGPYLREGGWKEERESGQWKEMLKRRKKMRKVKRREELREEVARVQRGEVSAVEVFEEKMKRRVEGKALRDAGERRKEEKRLRKKEAWLKRMKEGKAAAIAAKRVASEGVGGRMPPGCAPTGFGVTQGTSSGVRCSPSSKGESVVDTLLGRVAALEERLEVQEVREKRRVSEAYEEGRSEGVRAQGKKGEAVVKELMQRSEQKVRRLTWELEEEKRKGLLQRRSSEGVRVKDRLMTVRGSRLPRPVVVPAVKTVVRAAPQWKNWNEQWEAAKTAKVEAVKEMARCEVMKIQEEDGRWGVEVPKPQRAAGGGRGARRAGVFRNGQTDVRLGTPGVRIVVDKE
jgi:hypothetical protein